ncbi:hypothetical protein [Mucilaginibacter myungsuensis]|uniref:Uncharacterized protein n=1 Tax=Mucilaginibacter myungsuensis TaxID=649104 RepID=A0A929L3H2_9SPHI|nr:hypothetical protein [Mucilaginibacter myungsuensis]MBE9663779.1 hypothetical protein [Mucilaginibacter myungsuensis]MDN3598507.1 hypothetical protein [Mucilaginibacter myungsuensis]
MKVSKKNWLNSVLAIILLCTMTLKMGVAFASHFTKCTENFSIEKNAEEGKDTKEESFNKGDKKLLFAGHNFADHVQYSPVRHAKPVCRYRLQDVVAPPQTIHTPPPNHIG